MNENQEAMTREELEQAMRLPMADILKLPPVKRDAVWNELAKQMFELPDALRSEAADRVETGDVQGFVQAFDTANDLENAISEVTTVVKRLLHSNEEAMDRAQATAQALAEGPIASLLLAIEKAQADFADRQKIWAERTKALAPFIEAEEQAARARGDLHITYRDVIVAAKKKAIEAGALEPDPAEETGDAVETLLQISGANPKNHVMPNNALMNKLVADRIINQGAFDLVVAHEGKPSEITAYTMVQYDGAPGITAEGGLSLTEYERQVSDAIITLWLNAVEKKEPTIFTIGMIFRAMPGGSDKPSAEQANAIVKAIEKFRRLRITVDATTEARKRGTVGDTGTFQVNDNYFQIRECQTRMKRGGQVVTAYMVTVEPIMLTYCKMTNQVLTVPAKYLEIKKVKNGKASTELLAMSMPRQSMTGYILRRIEVMKRDRKAKDSKQRPVILFDSLFKNAGLAEQTKQRAADNRKFVYKLLDFQTVIGNIKGYEKQTEGQSITGVKIHL